MYYTNFFWTQCPSAQWGLWGVICTGLLFLTLCLDLQWISAQTICFWIKTFMLSPCWFKVWEHGMLEVTASLVFQQNVALADILPYFGMCSDSTFCAFYFLYLWWRYSLTRKLSPTHSTKCHVLQWMGLITCHGCRVHHQVVSSNCLSLILSCHWSYYFFSALPLYTPNMDNIFTMLLKACFN